MPDLPARAVARLIAAALLGAVVMVACSTGSTPSPSMGAVTNADEAVAVVLAQDPRFETIRPHDADLIGQASWTKVEPTDGGWTVTVRIGWGDCPSGCIDEHIWVYEVTTTGEVAIVDEEGPTVPGDVFEIP